MAKNEMQKYTVNDFRKEFPDDTACLLWLRDYRWPGGIYCKVCGKITKHHLMSTRRSFCCQECGNHVHPTAGTIFHKSTTALTTWFYTIYLMASTRGGISAKQIQRETGVTYKTAWRMFKLIRSRLDENGGDPFKGNVEADESYFGGRKRGGKRGRGSENKTPVLGVVERKGRVKAIAVPNVQGRTILPIVAETVERGATVHTDEFSVYDRLESMGYAHKRIIHAEKIYVIGDSHTQTIDGFWGNVKNGIRGVYHHVSDKYLQHYLNEYSFRYNHRKDVTPMFKSFLHQI
jgi:transposase